MIWQLMKQDFRFQARHGFYIVYAFVSLFYIIILHWMPVDIRDDVAPVIVLMDPAAVGFFIVGAGVLLERSQGVLNPIFVTPIRLQDYIWSKAITLAILGFVSGEVVLIGSLGRLNWLGSIGLYAISVIMSLFGLALAVTSENSQYIFNESIARYDCAAAAVVILFSFSFPFDIFRFTDSRCAAFAIEQFGTIFAV